MKTFIRIIFIATCITAVSCGSDEPGNPFAGTSWIEADPDSNAAAYLEFGSRTFANWDFQSESQCYCLETGEYSVDGSVITIIDEDSSFFGTFRIFGDSVTFSVEGEDTITFVAGDFDADTLTPECAFGCDEDDSETFQITFGDAGLQTGTSVVQTSDGGYGFLARTNTLGAGSTDMWLIRVDESGSEQWNATFGGSGEDISFSLIESDGGFILAGRSNSFSAGDYDVYLVKTDALGNEVWSQTHDFVGSEESGGTIQETPEGYVFFGSSTPAGGTRDFLILTVDGTGVERWHQTYDDGNDDWATSGLPTSDGGYLICGQSNSPSGGADYDVLLLKTDDEGTEQWRQYFGGSLNESFTSVAPTSDGGYIIAVEVCDLAFIDLQMLLIKTDANGDEQWSVTFDGSGRDGLIVGSTVYPTVDGGYVVLGTTDSFGAGGFDIWLIKTDSNGAEEWSRTFGGESNEFGAWVRPTNDFGFIFAGHTESFGQGDFDAWLVKTNAFGFVVE